jgi:bifunctional lysine-specific demethylase and histidyl-hydroxylase NO66
VRFARIGRPPQTATQAKPAQPESGTASGALHRCVEPVQAGRFLDEYWEQKPLLVPRDEEGRFDDLLSVEEVEGRVTGGGLRYPAFRVVKEGETYSVDDYAEDVSWSPRPFSGTARVERVAAEFERGATIVLQALHVHHPPLAGFCRDLERELGHPAQTNAYYTPPSAQGFKVHHDTHDVFCLQVAGEKRWLVYPPALELPLKSQKYTPELGDPGEAVLDVTMRAGDTLYLPRGWLHQAMTSDTASLHLTVGISVATWLDALQAALKETAREEVALRRGVPEDGEAPDGLLELLARRLTPESVSSRRRRSFVGSRRPVREDAFDQVRLLEDLDVETPLERRETVIFDLVVGNEEATLSFEGRDLHFPARIGAELEFLAGAEGPFLLSDLPGRVDDAGRLVLGRRLVREGFLRISAD